MSGIQYPPELLSIICAHIYASCLHPSLESSLDPIIPKDYGIPVALPSSLPPSSWPEPVVRHTLANLCLVNHAWNEAAKPWLWHKVEIRLPRSWLALVETVAWDYNEETVHDVMDHTIRAAAKAAVASSNPGSPRDKDEEHRLQESILDSLEGPETSISPELLSPVASRDPSPRRLRGLRAKSESPARWKLLRSISDAIHHVMERREPGVYIPVPSDPRPGRFVQHLDFNHFRTIGMRRSVEEGVNSRFVTGDRVQAVIKEMPNLTVFGATEYMDGALTLPVLNELFLRGAPSRGRGRPPRGRGSAIMDGMDAEDEDRERRRECRDLEAVDLTGCVSAVFVNALTEFVNAHLLPAADVESSVNDGSVNSRRSSEQDAMVFPGLQRLGMRGVKSVTPRILSPFLLAFPSLTHLDISGTRVTPDLLQTLGESPTVRLRSLALSRCIKLTSASIKNFIIDSPVTSQLAELNLYGDMTFTSPLTTGDLRDILALAPCFLSGNLLYLDLSSAPLTEDILLNVCRPQLKLRSLGLSHIPDLELKAVTGFLASKAPNVEVLTLIGTSPELDCGLRAGHADPHSRGSLRKSPIHLHTQLIRPLCTPPFSFSLTTPTLPPAPPPSRVRVIELSTMLLSGLGAGAGAWRILRSKGGRGWYVDTASGWVAQSGSGEGSVLRRDLEPTHPLRTELEILADANGNVSSGVGWHARKMEVLHGHGMLGREDGLYGAVSFAYQG